METLISRQKGGRTRLASQLGAAATSRELVPSVPVLMVDLRLSSACRPLSGGRSVSIWTPKHRIRRALSWGGHF